MARKLASCAPAITNKPDTGRLRLHCADPLGTGQRHERRDGHTSELLERTTQRPDEQEQLVIGDTPPPQLDLRDHRPLHIPAEELKLPRQVRLRPSLLLPRTAQKKSQRVALRWLLGSSRTCHFRHLTLATEQPLIGCHYWHIRMTLADTRITTSPERLSPVPHWIKSRGCPASGRPPSSHFTRAMP